MTPRRIAVVTGSRADYGYLFPVLRAINEHPDLDLHVLVTGMHLSTHYGLSLTEIVNDGFPVAATVHALLASDTPEAISHSVGLGIQGFARTYEQLKPDLIVVFGDRFEMFAAAVAAVPFRIPLAHIGGGENTIYVTMDVGYRAALTKFSHLHFVSIPAYADKLLDMGEEPWRIHVVGSPTIDYILSMEDVPTETLADDLQLDFSKPVAVVTYHPTTMEDPALLGSYVATLLDALASFPDLQQVITFPNADTRNSVIVQLLQEYQRSRPNVRLVRNLGSRRYISLLRRATVMVGNSSSGIIEAPSFRLPVVNIGNRQAGRVRAANVIDVPHTADAIREAIRQAMSAEFRESLKDLTNPYGDGQAGPRIARILAEIPLDDRLLIKEMAVPRGTMRRDIGPTVRS